MQFPRTGVRDGALHSGRNVHWINTWIGLDESSIEEISSFGTIEYQGHW